jgi:5-deoxy-glucuronate isomerase
VSDETEVFIAGAKYDEVLEPFAVRKDELDLVQYGSDDTKTHRKIKHILGQKQKARLAVCWSASCTPWGRAAGRAFPATSTTPTVCPMKPGTTRPTISASAQHGSGVQMLQREDNKPGDAYHIVDGSTICLDKGYHPCACCRATRCIISPFSAGSAQRSLMQYFQPTHAYQIETIPGIKDMVAKFK